jgi:hypothetical protein
MKQTDYQDVLRALGHFIDEHGYSDIRIVETEDGLVLQGRVPERHAIGESSFETYLITDDDIKTMVRDSFLRRGQKPPTYSE